MQTVSDEEVQKYRKEHKGAKYLSDERIKEKLGELKVESEQNKNVYKTIKKVKQYNENNSEDIIVFPKKKKSDDNSNNRD